jgi:hypothetical protein
VTDVLASERRAATGPRVRAIGALLVRHRALVAVLVAAATLRIVAVVAVYPGIWFSDSNSYVLAAASHTLSPIRVMGYSLVVAPFWQLGSAGALIVTQHVLGLAVVVALYAWLVARGVARWLAALAVVPAALDAYLIAVEHAIMSEAVFHAALVGAIVVLLWKERAGMVAAAASGLLLGYAGVVRSVAIPFIVVLAAYLLMRRVGWRPLAALCLGWAVVVGGYAAVYSHQHGALALTQWQGRFLYAKVARFADCSRLAGLPADERALCPDPRHRLTTNAYLWGTNTPIRGIAVQDNGRISDFALRVVRDAPLTYAGDVARDVLHYFEPGHRIGVNDYTNTTWRFPADPRRWGYPGYRGPIRRATTPRRRTGPAAYVDRMVGTPRLNVAASGFLHAYQGVAYTSGLLLAACLIAIALALVRARGAAGRLTLDAALLGTLVLVSLLVSSALSVFSYRYSLTAAILLPPAAALAVTALRRVRSGEPSLPAEIPSSR